MGGGKNAGLAGPVPTVEQGLRGPASNNGVLGVHSDDPCHAPATGTRLNDFGNSLSGITGAGSPAHAEMHYAKPQLLTDTFQLPKRGGKKKQKPAPRANNTKKRTPPKDPVPKKAPLTPEARRERRRIRHKEKLERVRLSGQCRHCSEPAIPSQTRCETCAEKHRVSRRLNDAKRDEKTKELRKCTRATAEGEATATSAPTKCRHCKEPSRSDPV